MDATTVQKLEEIREALEADLGEAIETKMVFGKKVRVKKHGVKPFSQKRQAEKRQAEKRRKIGGKSLAKWKEKARARVGASL
jgi:hypothetical protein